MIVMKKNLANLILFLVSALFCLFAVELALRMFYPQNLSLSYQTRDGLKILRPNHQGIYRGVETARPYQTNSFGMRDREHSVEKAPGTVRILLLGDSFMEALQVRFEDSFPKLLEDRLRLSSTRPVEVINVAVSGWGTDDELAYLERYGVRLKPDLILVAMTMTNDISDNLRQRFHSMANDLLEPKPVEKISFVAYLFWQAKAYLGSHSHLYQLIRLWWHSSEIEIGGVALNNHVAEQIRRNPGERISQGWRLTHQLLLRINSIGKELGSKTVIFLIPITFQFEAENLGSFLKAQQLSAGAVDIEGPQRVMIQFGQERGIPVIDLLPGFKEWRSRGGKPLVLKNDGHWNESGHRLAVELVSRDLLEGRFLNLGQPNS